MHAATYFTRQLLLVLVHRHGIYTLYAFQAVHKVHPLGFWSGYGPAYQCQVNKLTQVNQVNPRRCRGWGDVD